MNQPALPLQVSGAGLAGLANVSPVRGANLGADPTQFGQTLAREIEQRQNTTPAAAPRASEPAAPPAPAAAPTPPAPGADAAPEGHAEGARDAQPSAQEGAKQAPDAADAAARQPEAGGPAAPVSHPGPGKSAGAHGHRQRAQQDADDSARRAAAPDASAITPVTDMLALAASLAPALVPAAPAPAAGKAAGAQAGAAAVAAQARALGAAAGPARTLPVVADARAAADDHAADGFANALTSTLSALGVGARGQAEVDTSAATAAVATMPAGPAAPAGATVVPPAPAVARLTAGAAAVTPASAKVQDAAAAAGPATAGAPGTSAAGGGAAATAAPDPGRAAPAAGGTPPAVVQGETRTVSSTASASATAAPKAEPGAGSMDMLRSHVQAQPARVPEGPVLPSPLAVQAQAAGLVASPAATLAAQAGAPAASHLGARVGSSAWNDQVGQKIVWMAAGGEQSAELTLNPPDLGPMQVVLSVHNDQASVSFSSAQPEVRQALEQAMPRLREMMSESGIALGSATVNAGQPQHQPGGGEQRQAAQPGQSGPRYGGDGGASDTASAPVRAPRRLDNGLVDTFA